MPFLSNKLFSQITITDGVSCLTNKCQGLLYIATTCNWKTKCKGNYKGPLKCTLFLYDNHKCTCTITAVNLINQSNSTVHGRVLAKKIVSWLRFPFSWSSTFVRDLHVEQNYFTPNLWQYSTWNAGLPSFVFTRWRISTR